MHEGANDDEKKKNENNARSDCVAAHSFFPNIHKLCFPKSICTRKTTTTGGPGKRVAVVHADEKIL